MQGHPLQTAHQTKYNHHLTVTVVLILGTLASPFIGVTPTISYEEEVLADSPTAYWKLDDTSGTAAVEEIAAVPSLYTGTVTKGQPPLITVGTSVEWVGAANSGIQVNNTPSHQILGDITIEAWVNMNSLSGNMYIVNCSSRISRPEQESDNYLWSLTLDASGFMRSFWEYGVGTNQTTLSTHAITTGTVHHLVIVRDATAKTCTFFDNGVEYDTVGYAENATGGGDSIVQIAKRLSGGEADGFIDQVAFYNTKLTPARILAHYNAGL